jgi:hypothetical protein
LGGQIDAFAMMASAKDRPTEEFQDFSFVFWELLDEIRNSSLFVLADKASHDPP